MMVAFFILQTIVLCKAVLIPAHVKVDSSEFSLNKTEFSPKSFPFDMSGCEYFPKSACIGVQKAATSSLYLMVRDCVNLCYQEKELHLFDDAVVNDVFSKEHLCERYKYMWKPRTPGPCLAFESTPSNGIMRTAAEVYAASQLDSLFVILRDPIDRMVSAYNMETARSPRCSKKKKDVVWHFQRQLLEELKRLVEKNATSHARLGSQFIDNVNGGCLLKSLYDRIFHVYRKVDLQVLFFEDVVQCSESLFTTLEEMLVHWRNKTGSMSCIRNLCQQYRNAPDNAHDDKCTNVDADDVPGSVAEYIRAHNRWYYENNPYLRHTNE